MVYKTIRRCVGASVVAIFLACPAVAAVDAQKVLDALKLQFSKQGLTVNAASVELQGSNVVLKGTSFSAGPDPKAIPLGDVVLENVTEDGAGFKVGQVQAPAYQQDKDGISFNFGGASIKDVIIAPPDATDPLAAVLYYSSVTINPVSVSVGGKETFRMDGISMNVSPYAPGQKITFDMLFSGLYGNLSAIPDPSVAGVAAALGYSELNGTISAKGSWDPADGRVVISEETFDIKDVGKLNFTFDISGYTSDFLKELQAINQSGGSGDPANAQKMMGVMQKLSFNSMTLRFDDASLTGRLLDFAAKQSGQTKEAIAMQVKAAAPMAVMQLQDATFAGAVSNAVNAYMDNPKSLTIKATPAQPVEIGTLIASGAGNPAAVIKQLNVTIEANN